MSTVQIICVHCGTPALRKVGDVNRAIKTGKPLFCTHSCFSKSRKLDRPLAEKRELKRLYDAQYRKLNREKIKLKKAAYFQKDYKANPEKYRQIRKKLTEYHNEYCRRPEYRAKKHTYDRARYAKKTFGEAWESHVLIMKINEECRKKMSTYESMLKRGLLNKALQRSRNGKVKRSYT